MSAGAGRLLPMFSAFSSVAAAVPPGACGC
jgi:hypothetical protein